MALKAMCVRSTNYRLFDQFQLERENVQAGTGNRLRTSTAISFGKPPNGVERRKRNSLQKDIASQRGHDWFFGRWSQVKYFSGHLTGNGASLRRCAWWSTLRFDHFYIFMTLGLSIYDVMQYWAIQFLTFPFPSSRFFYFRGFSNLITKSLTPSPQGSDVIYGQLHCMNQNLARYYRQQGGREDLTWPYCL